MEYEMSNKIKRFLWRLAHNSLALRMNLKRRRMKVDTKCIVCQRLDEDGAHLFFKCKEAKKLWQVLNLDAVRGELAALQSPIEVLNLLMVYIQFFHRSTEFYPSAIRGFAEENRHHFVELVERKEPDQGRRGETISANPCS